MHRIWWRLLWLVTLPRRRKLRRFRRKFAIYRYVRRIERLIVTRLSASNYELAS